MAVQDDNITNAMKEEQITWLKHRFHSLINDFEKLKEVSDVRSLEETIHKIQRCFKKLEDLRFVSLF